jgi:hypothetical protein
MPLKIKDRGMPELVQARAEGRDQLVRWWELKPGPDRARAIYSTVRTLEQEQSGLRQLRLLHMSMYSNGNVSGEGLKSTLKWQSTQPIRLRLNLANAVCDALVAKIAKLRPRPRLITTGGDWGLRKRAEAAEQALDGEFYRNRLDELSPRVALDAFVEGTGFWHVCRRGDGRPTVERCAPGEIVVGYYDGLYQEPCTMYRARLCSRDELLDRFSTGPNSAAAKLINAANASPPNHYPWLSAHKQSGDVVYCIEAWHTGINKAHAFVCGDFIHTNTEWTGERIPIVPYRWSERQYGYFGKGAVEEITPHQIEVNYNLEKIQHILHNVSTVRYWVQAGQSNKIEFNAKRATNFPGEFLQFYGSQPPIKEATDSVPREMWEAVDRGRAQAYQQVGLNENFASATKPAGLNSGEAQRVYEDVGDARMLLKGRQYESAHLRLAEILIDVKQEIAKSSEKESPVVVQRKGARGVTVASLSFRDWDMDKYVYQMQLLEQSALPGTPSGKTATVQEWLQMGLISIDEGKELLNMPDVKAELSLSLSTKNSVLSAIESMADEGEYPEPHAFMDLALAARLAMASYTRMEQEGLPDDRLELLAIYISDLQALTEAAAPPMAAPAGMPMAGSPGLPDVAGQLAGTPMPTGM